VNNIRASGLRILHSPRKNSPPSCKEREDETNLRALRALAVKRQAVRGKVTLKVTFTG